MKLSPYLFVYMDMELGLYRMSNMLVWITTSISGYTGESSFTTFSIILHSLKSTDKNKLCSQQIDSMADMNRSRSVEVTRVRKVDRIWLTTKRTFSIFEKFSRHFFLLFWSWWGSCFSFSYFRLLRSFEL